MSYVMNLEEVVLRQLEGDCEQDVELVENLSVEEASELLHLPELLLDYIGVMMLKEAVEL
jgi:hypothetical protein